MTQTMLSPAPAALAQPVYEITEADKKRQKKIAEAWQAYNDELDKPLTPMPGQPDDNVMSNRVQPVVDAGVDFLFGKEVEISVAEGSPQEAQDCLDDAWDIKEVRIPLLQKLAMNGAAAGHAFLRIVPEDDGSFHLVVIDPSTVFVQTAPQDCERVLLFCIQYSSSERENGQPREVFYREEIAGVYPEPGASGKPTNKATSWNIQHWTQVGNIGMTPKPVGWTPAGEPIVWPYEFPPLFGCQNLPNPNDYWGKPDVTPGLIGLNNALNLVNSSTNRILKMYGQPIIWATGAAESSIAIQPGSIIVLGSAKTDASMQAVAITSDIPHAIAFAADLRSDIDEVTHVPGAATGRITTMPRGALSGVALELLFMPLQKKTDTKQCLYGKLIIDVSKALLVLNRMSEDIDITLAWQSPLPHDDLAAMQAAVLKLQIGISKATVQRENGYDPEEEMLLAQTEDAQALLNYSRGQGMPPPGMPGMAPQVALPGQPAQAPGQPAPLPASPFIGGHP